MPDRPPVSADPCMRKGQAVTPTFTPICSLPAGHEGGCNWSERVAERDRLRAEAAARKATPAPPVSAENVPASVVEAAYEAADAQFPSSAQSRWLMPAVEAALEAACRQWEEEGAFLIRLDGQGLERVARAAGLRLVRDDEVPKGQVWCASSRSARDAALRKAQVRDDEATVERVAAAICAAHAETLPVTTWSPEPPISQRYWRDLARAALTAAQAKSEPANLATAPAGASGLGSDDEATVEAMARAIHDHGCDDTSGCDCTSPSHVAAYKTKARAALTAAQGGEG